MKTRCVLTTTFLLLFASTGFAQQPEQPGAQPVPDREIDRDRGALERDVDVDVDIAVADPLGAEMLTRREPGQIRSDELVGADVLDSAGDNVASVNELLIGQDGRIAALLVDVGGILGLGATTVALTWDSVEIHRVEDAFEVRTHMTREQLEDAPEFEDDGDDWF